MTGAPVTRSRKPSVHQAWAHLRFSVVGRLLAAPPARGELEAALKRLAAKKWLHPDSGEQASMGDAIRQALLAQYKAHKGWSYQLHYDNLEALAEMNPEVGDLASYSTVRRFM